MNNTLQAPFETLTEVTIVTTLFAQLDSSYLPALIERVQLSMESITGQKVCLLTKLSIEVLGTSLSGCRGTKVKITLAMPCGVFLQLPTTYQDANTTK